MKILNHCQPLWCFTAVYAKICENVFRQPIDTNSVTLMTAHDHIASDSSWRRCFVCCLLEQTICRVLFVVALKPTPHSQHRIGKETS